MESGFFEFRSGEAVSWRVRRDIPIGWAQAQASGCSLRRYMLLRALPTRAELQVHSSALRRGWRTPPLCGMRKTTMTIQMAFFLHIDSLGGLRHGAELKVHFSAPRRKSISRLHDEDDNIKFSGLFLWGHSLRLREQCEVTPSPHNKKTWLSNAEIVV